MATLGAALAIGCGEREFSPQEFVEEMNAGGAGLVLGDPLPTGAETDSEVVSVSFDDHEEGEEAGAHDHAAGAVVILDDATKAEEEFVRCESAVDFTCFRAANAVVRFTGITPEEQDRVTQALRSIADE